MIRVFREGRDMHKYTASVLLGKKEEEITKEERQLAKAVNFGLIYGISAKGLQNTLTLPMAYTFPMRKRKKG
jgi:DNA polymerase-1